MAEQKAEQEPTMEEILASIRRIINEDEEGEKAAPEAANAEPEPAPEPAPALAAVSEPSPEAEAELEDEAEDEPVFELTETVEPDEEAHAAAFEADDNAFEAAFEAAERTERDLEAPDPVAAQDDEVMIVDEADGETPGPEPVLENEEEESLLDEAAAGAAAGAFSALSQNVRVSAPGEGQTLEHVVRELLRPLLKQWLDENLPAIVQEKVEAEIERVARRRR